jgi:ATP-dependent Lon protease
MLAHCLENERMFCVALLRPGVEEASTREDFFPMAGLGLVRACVGHPDGTAHLVLQGLARVELGVFTQELPFRIAELREIPTQTAAGTTVDALVKKLRHTCDQFIPGDGDDRRKLKEQIAQVTDAGMLCDMVAHTFLQNAYTQQEVLESLAVEERLRLVETHLRQEMSQNGAE